VAVDYETKERGEIMPIKSCTRDGKNGYKFGDAGFCFLGSDAEKKARMQGVATLMSEARAAGHTDKKSMEAYVASKSHELAKV
jgi:hypothetical protein